MFMAFYVKMHGYTTPEILRKKKSRKLKLPREMDVQQAM